MKTAVRIGLIVILIGLVGYMGDNLYWEWEWRARNRAGRARVKELKTLIERDWQRREAIRKYLVAKMPKSTPEERIDWDRLIVEWAGVTAPRIIQDLRDFKNLNIQLGRRGEELDRLLTRHPEWKKKPAARGGRFAFAQHLVLDLATSSARS
jgi:hypothetical protein